MISVIKLPETEDFGTQKRTFVRLRITLFFVGEKNRAELRRNARMLHMNKNNIRAFHYSPVSLSALCIDIRTNQYESIVAASVRIGIVFRNRDYSTLL
jgi:hypothetical protein